VIDPKLYLDALLNEGVTFFTGVPDSLLKDFCACITASVKKEDHVIAANEGAAIGLAIGRHLGSGELPLVYLQNSGLGNIVNPLLSLASPQVYGIPMLILLGWRGEPGVKDEPQHIHQGSVMIDMLDAMNVPSIILSNDFEEIIEQTKTALKLTRASSGPVALIARKEIFKDFFVDKVISKREISREEAIIKTINLIEPNAVIISTTGMASRELFEYRASKEMGHNKDFLTVGGMGHANQIALGLASSQKDRPVYCFDGDGAALMHMGSLAVIGQSKRDNFIHILLNNGVHDSVGGQPTVGFDIDFCKIANACGYSFVVKIKNKDEIKKAVEKAKKIKGPCFIEIQTTPGNKKNIGRPTSSPKENKENLIKFLDS
tara:strand:- start:448 stop:1572 length:1125 start_codon:yes stop_codon:yes gene_type:complete